MGSPAFDLGYGLTLIVVFVSCILFGVVIAQAQHYYINYPRDRWLKLLVTTMLILDALSTAFAMAWLLDALVVHWGDVSALTSFNFGWLLPLNPLFCGLMGLLVHSFFAWRLYMLTRSWIWPSFVAIFALPAFGGCLRLYVASTHATAPTRVDREVMAILWLASSALADVTITASLSLQLRKRRGHFGQTNHLLDRLVILTVPNGLLTALTATTDLALFLNYGSPTHTVSFLIPKMYSNSVLSSLNFRRVHHDGDLALSQIVTERTTESSSQGQRDRWSRRIAANDQPRHLVNIHREQHVTVDLSTGDLEAVDDAPLDSKSNPVTVTRVS